MLNQRNYKLWRKYGLASPIKFANAHALREAGRLIYNADHRVKTDMRIRMQQNTHEYRHNLHKRLREAQEKKEEQEIKQLHILEDYAAMVEGALNIDGIKAFGYAGLEMQEALTSIQTSLEKLEKGGRSEPNMQEAPHSSQDHCELA